MFLGYAMQTSESTEAKVDQESANTEERSKRKREEEEAKRRGGGRCSVFYYGRGSNGTSLQHGMVVDGGWMDGHLRPRLPVSLSGPSGLFFLASGASFCVVSVLDLLWSLGEEY